MIRLAGAPWQRDHRRDGERLASPALFRLTLAFHMAGRRGLERLRYFAAFVDDLASRHDLSTLGSQLTLTVDASGTTVAAKEPEEHRLRSYLIDARRLFTKGEDTDLAVILEEAPKHISDPTALKAVTEPMEHFHHLRGRGDVGLIVNGEELRPAELTALMVQGTIFHGDRRKEIRWTALMGSDPVTAALVRNNVLAFVGGTVSLAIWVASVIRHEDEAGRLR